MLFFSHLMLQELMLQLLKTELKCCKKKTAVWQGRQAFMKNLRWVVKENRDTNN